MPLNRAFVLSALAAAALLPLGAAQAAGVPGQGTWETTLLPRDINGDGTVDAFYDTVLDVSWLANANVAGQMNWVTAKAWATDLDVYGTTGWRLPTMIDTGPPGCDLTYAGGTDCGTNVQTISQDGQTVFSELAHLYYVSLGNKAHCDPARSTASNCVQQSGSGLTNTGAFRNLQALYYWFGVARPLTGPFETIPYAWNFGANGGYQFDNPQYYLNYAVAVRPGDVTAAVPEPQTYALLLMGVAGVLVAVRRRAI